MVTGALQTRSYTGIYDTTLAATANTVGAYQPTNYSFVAANYSKQLVRYTPAANPFALLVTRNPPNLTVDGIHYDFNRQSGSGVVQSPSTTNTVVTQITVAGWYVIECDIAFSYDVDSKLDYSGVVYYNNSEAVNINFGTDPTIANYVSNSVVGGYGSQAYISNSASTTNPYAFENVRQYRKLVQINNTGAFTLACMLYSPYFWTNAVTDVISTTSTAYPANLAVSPKRSAIVSHLSVRQASAAEIAGNTANAAVPVINASITNLSNVVVTQNAAVATQITTLNTQYNTLSANVAILANSISTANGASSSYSLKLDANGVVTGMQTFAGSNGISTFDVYASNFTLSDPNAPALKFKPLSFANGVLYLGNTVVNGSFIINGTVITDTIGNNAVSNLNYYGGNGSSSTKADIGSLTLTTYGYPCSIVAYFFATPNVPVRYAGLANELRRDGNLVGKSSVVAVEGSALNYQVTINLLDNPSAGSHTYSMSCPEGYDVTFTGWNITVTEFKR